MRPDTEQDYHERILKVLIHIQDHLDQAVSLEELASVTCFSPYHFHRIFKVMVGESVMEHVRRLRLERAAWQLKLSDQPVTRVAFDAGYETHEAFTRAFRAMFGEPPKRFREQHRAVPLQASPSHVHYRPDGRLTDFKPVMKGDGPMDVRIEKIEPIRVAFIRRVGPYTEVGPTWEKLGAWAGPGVHIRAGMIASPQETKRTRAARARRRAAPSSGNHSLITRLMSPPHPRRPAAYTPGQSSRRPYSPQSTVSCSNSCDAA
jgi:AraC family transcriptional regulator